MNGYANKAPFTRECNRSVPFRSVSKSGTIKGCVHIGTLQITSFRSKKWNDETSDANGGTIRNRSVPFRSVPFRSVPFRSVPFLCEQAMRIRSLHIQI